MLPFLPLNPLASDEKVNSETLVEASILIPKHAHHIAGLYEKRSSLTLKDGTRLTEAGLYTSKSVKAGQLIGLYTGYMIADAQYRRLPIDVKMALGRYTVSMHESNMQVSPVNPSSPYEKVDFMRHPLALTNEPAKGMHANAFVEARAVEMGDAMFECLCMYACNDIQEHSEILWMYGKAYRRIGYKAGIPCSKESGLEQPFDMLSNCRSQPEFEFVAVQLEG